MLAPFAHVAVCLISHRGVCPETDDLKDALAAAGATVIKCLGTDLCLGRNTVLSEALHKRAVNPALTVALMLDDDNSASLNDTLRLCTWPRQDIDQAPLRAAVYATTDARMSASRFPKRYTPLHGFPTPTVPYTAGLGLAAVRLDALGQVARNVPYFVRDKIRQWEFASARSVDGQWVPDDESICRLFGGATIDHTVLCHHHKTVALTPDEETLRRIKDNDF